MSTYFAFKYDYLDNIVGNGKNYQGRYKWDKPELGKEITLFHKALTLTEFHALSRDEQIKACEFNLELEKKYTKYILEEAKRQYDEWKDKQCILQKKQSIN